MLKKRLVYVFFVMLTILAIARVTKAMPDPFATLTVWPVGTPEGSEGPMVTTSPADLMIYNNDAAHILDDVWLMLVINPVTYAHLGGISTDTGLNFHKDDFNAISSTEDPATMIPEVGCTAPDGWPGVYDDDKNNVGSYRSKLGTESFYYAVGDLDSSPGWHDVPPAGLDKTDIQFFTLTVELEDYAEPDLWKVLVQAFGHSGTYEGPMLDVHSPYTRSSLVLIPEVPLGTVAIALSWLGVLGIFVVRKKRSSR